MNTLDIIKRIGDKRMKKKKLILPETTDSYSIVSRWTMHDVSYTLFDMPDGHRYLEAKYIKKPEAGFGGAAAVSVIHSPACHCHAK